MSEAALLHPILFGWVLKRRSLKGKLGLATYRAEGEEWSSEKSQLACGHSQVSIF